MTKDNIKIFDKQQIRVQYDEEIQDYYYSLIDVIAALTNSKNPGAYWRKYKQNINNEELVKKIHSLKLPASDGKLRTTDVATDKTIIKIIEPINSDNKKQFKQWLTTNQLQQIDTHKQLVQTLLYTGKEGSVKIEVILDNLNETMWASQKTLSQLFQVNITDISYHLKNIFTTGELDKNSVFQKNWITASDGKKYNTSFYNLDAIISVGYRINTKEATRFRMWATDILHEYIIKGFVLDDELLKNGSRFGIDYFDNLLERIRAIRASERRFYQKITDIYATSHD